MECPELVCNSFRKLTEIHVSLLLWFPQGHLMTKLIVSISHYLCIPSTRKEDWIKRTCSVLDVPCNTMTKNDWPELVMWPTALWYTEKCGLLFQEVRYSAKSLPSLTKEDRGMDAGLVASSLIKPSFTSLYSALVILPNPTVACITSQISSFISLQFFLSHLCIPFWLFHPNISLDSLDFNQT